MSMQHWGIIGGLFAVALVALTYYGGRNISRMTWKMILIYVLTKAPAALLAVVASYGVAMFYLEAVPFWVAFLAAIAYESVYISLSLQADRVDLHTARYTFVVISAVGMSVISNSLYVFAVLLAANTVIVQALMQLTGGSQVHVAAVLGVLHGMPLSILSYNVLQLLAAKNPLQTQAERAEEMQPIVTVFGAQMQRIEYINEVRQALTHFFGKRCMKCGATDRAFHVDHILPTSRGGSDDVTNLQLLCDQCNLYKGNQEIIDYRPQEPLPAFLDAFGYSVDDVPDFLPMQARIAPKKATTSTTVRIVSTPMDATTMEIVRLKDEEGKSFGEIGKRFGFTRQAAQHRYRSYKELVSTNGHHEEEAVN